MEEYSYDGVAPDVDEEFTDSDTSNTSIVPNTPNNFFIKIDLNLYY